MLFEMMCLSHLTTRPLPWKHLEARAPGHRKNKKQCSRGDVEPNSVQPKIVSPGSSWMPGGIAVGWNIDLARGIGNELPNSALRYPMFWMEREENHGGTCTTVLMAKGSARSKGNKCYHQQTPSRSMKLTGQVFFLECHSPWTFNPTSTKSSCKKALCDRPCVTLIEETCSSEVYLPNNLMGPPIVDIHV